MNLTVWNHKNIEAEIVVEFSNYYGSNLALTWRSPSDFAIENTSSSLIKLKKVFKANEKYAFLWNENYRP